MNNFYTLGLPEALVKSLPFKTPTPIQEQAIPLALKGHDILGSAQTGTGKTAAFGLPLITKLLENPEASALIITPTRELATQVLKALQEILGRDSPIRSCQLIGGDSMHKQLQRLKKNPRLIVGTPGRINDHLIRKTVSFRDTRFLVLDEADRMLDMGFSDQIATILNSMPRQRQTLFFSATFSKNVTKLAETYLNNPKHIAIGKPAEPAKNIKQSILRIKDSEKYPQLLDQLNTRKGSIIVFVKTKHGAEKMAKNLRKENHKSDTIHGNLRQSKRDRVIKAFRNQDYRILVATDVAARGLDIPHIEHVINYDLPQCPEDYIHRIGRTARAGAEGEALCFVTPSDSGKWNAIDRILNPGAKRPSAPGKHKSRKPRKSDSGSFKKRRPEAKNDGTKRKFHKKRNTSKRTRTET